VVGDPTVAELAHHRRRAPRSEDLGAGVLLLEVVTNIYKKDRVLLDKNVLGAGTDIPREVAMTTNGRGQSFFLICLSPLSSIFLE
jgi:hypothetical protein